MAAQATSRVGATLARLRSLTLGIVVGTAVVAVATFLTGWWVFRRSHGAWIVLGGVLCLIPVLAAAGGRWLILRAAHAVPRLAGDVATLLRTSRQAAGPLIDHDSGAPLAQHAKSLGELRSLLTQRRAELPALFAGVRALTAVPGLVAVAVLGTLAAGVVGTILLLVGLLR